MDDCNHADLHESYDALDEEYTNAQQWGQGQAERAIRAEQREAAERARREQECDVNTDLARANRTLLEERDRLKGQLDESDRDSKQHEASAARLELDNARLRAALEKVAALTGPCVELAECEHAMCNAIRDCRVALK